MLANEPVYVGLDTGLVAYVVASLASPRTPAAVLDEWDRRSRGASEVSESAPAGWPALGRDDDVTHRLGSSHMLQHV